MSEITFRYAPAIANRDLIHLVDKNATLMLDGCSLDSTITGMRLTCGTILVDQKNYLSNAGATSLSQGFGFGNGNPNDDVDIQIMPGGSLTVVSGMLDYQNVN